MQRIMIVGQPGAGKSVLARALGRATGLHVVHIDRIHWQPGWVERAPEEKTRLCQEAEAREAWIFEGGHSATWTTRLERADLLIWLDLPLPLRFWRIVRRTVVLRGKTRPDLPENCPEGFHRETLPFWHYVLRTHRSGRRKLQGLWHSVPDGKPKRRLTSVREVRTFLSSLGED